MSISNNGNVFVGSYTVKANSNVGISLESRVGIRSHNNNDLLVVFDDLHGQRTEISIRDLFNRVQNLEAEFYLLGNKENKDG